MVTRRQRLLLAIVASALVLVTACGDDESDTVPIDDAGSDSDADTDTDTDTDTELDSGPTGDKATWVSAGGSHTCAVVEGGYVKCWGWSHFGGLGYGTDLYDDTDANTSLPSTLPFVRVGEAVSEIEAGGYHTCALLADDGAKCWGYAIYGQLGIETGMAESIGVTDVPADHDPIDFGGVKVKQISAAEGNFTCAILDGGDVKCFGYCAAGDTEDHLVELGGPASQLCTGVDHSCGVREDGEIYCWGFGQYGVLGYGDTDDVWEPLEKGPVDIGGTAVQVTCGYGHTCALLDGGDVVCWGNGEYGALGYGNTDIIGDDEVPASVGPVDVGATVTQLSAGSRHTCAVVESGDVKCWGAGGSGALGYGNPDSIGDDEVPADVGTVDIGAIVTQIDSGSAFNCVLTTLGTIRCWGMDDVGELGYGLGPGVTYIGDDETPASMGDVPLM